MSQHVDRDWKSRDKRGCTDKVKHRSKSSAEQEASRLTVSLGKKMNAYKCVYCRFNTWHVGTHIESTEAPVKQESYTQPLETFKRVLVKQEKKVEAEIKKGPFHVLAPMVEIERVDKEDEVKWTEKKRDTSEELEKKYPLSWRVNEIIRQMDLHTSNKLPSPPPKLLSVDGYKKHYDMKSNLDRVIEELGYLDKFPILGRMRVVQPQEFHDTFVKFLEDNYEEAIAYRNKEEEAKSIVAKVIKPVANPNDTLMASKLKEVIKAMQELLVIIEGERK